MNSLGKTSTPGSILPIFSTSGSQPTGLQQQQNEDASLGVDEEPPEQSTSTSRHVEQTDTILMHNPSSPIAVSSSHERDERYNEVAPENHTRQNRPSLGEISSVQEKPGEGFVWDIWAIMPRDAQRWHKPARWDFFFSYHHQIHI